MSLMDKEHEKLKVISISNLLTRFREDKFNGQVVIKMHKGKLSLIECLARGVGSDEIDKLDNQIKVTQEANNSLDNNDS